MLVRLSSNLARSALLSLLLVASVGCGYPRTILSARDALDEGGPEAAVQVLNHALGVASSSELPRDLSGDRALLVLQRGALLQKLGRFAESRRDLEAADQLLDGLDFVHQRRVRAFTKGFVGHLAASSTGSRPISVAEVAKVCTRASPALEYSATPTEHMLLNALNAANYLALGDADGATVEARRIDVFERYGRQRFGTKRSGVYALGEWLGGFAFDKTGQREAALERYAVAASLTAAGGLAGGEERADDAPELLVIVERGRAPFVSHEPVSASALEARLAGVAPDGMVALGRDGRGAPSPYGMTRPDVSVPVLRSAREEGIDVTLDGTPLPIAWELDVAATLRDEWSRAAEERALAAYICSGGVDLRSWETLPAHIGLARVRVRPGRHIVAGGRTPVTVDLAPGGWAVAVVAAPMARKLARPPTRVVEGPTAAGASTTGSRQTARAPGPRN